LIDCLAVWIVSVRRYPSKATAPRVKAHAIAVLAIGNHCAFMAGLKQGSPRADFSIKSEG
jgi:hypothetical protein